MTGVKNENYIPIPDASNMIDLRYYNVLFKQEYKRPSSHIQFLHVLEETIEYPYANAESLEKLDNKLMALKRQCINLSVSQMINCLCFICILFNILFLIRAYVFQPFFSLSITKKFQIPRFNHLMEWISNIFFLSSCIFIEFIYHHQSQCKNAIKENSLIPQPRR
jgi:hypothetical protein